MAISDPFDTAFYSGTVAVSAEVPGLFPVGLAGRTYLVDLLSGEFSWRSIPLLRQQADSQATPGEHSINPEDLWRRSLEDWSHGAGQVWYDRAAPTYFSARVGDPSRFRNSKGIDPWTRWQIALLNDTGQKRASANTNLAMVPVGTRLYITDGNTIGYTTDMSGASPTFTAVTSLPAANPTSIASDGFNVWTAHTASGIYATTRTTAGTASYATGTATLVAYVKGRLMAAGTNNVYNVIAGGALPTALFTHPNTDFTWVGFAETRKHILMAGYSGDKSLIYATAVKADGTGLDVPTVAGELPDGEIVRSIQGYLGTHVVIGTDKGVRYAEADTSGALRMGQLISTTSAVQCFEPQDRFVWFGWTNYDSTSTGLGRIDLSVFNEDDTPAYASDLMATGQGAVLSCATFQGVRCFAVSGLGFYGETTNKVASGTIDSGLVTYESIDTKMAVFLALQHSALVGTVAASISTDGGSFGGVGTNSEASSSGASFSVGQLLGKTFEVRLTLTRSASVTTTGPTVQRATLRTYPIPSRGEVILLPLVLHESLAVHGQVRPVDVRTEFSTLRGLTSNTRLVSLQLGAETVSVFVEDFEWKPTNMTQDGMWWNGIMTMKLKAVVE